MIFWEWWWILPLVMIVLCIFLMAFMMRSCMRKMRGMMYSAQNGGATESGMDMTNCPCMAMMGRFMKSPTPAKEERNERSK